jgi:hypothetical protein
VQKFRQNKQMVRANLLMKSNYKKVLLMVLALVFITFVEIPISATTSARSSNTKSVTATKHKDKKSVSKDKEHGKAAEEEITNVPGKDKLTQLAQAYQDNPNDNTYNELWEKFVAFTQQMTSKHKDPAHLFKAWKVLSQAGLKLIDPAGATSSTHIYAFNHISQNGSSFTPQTKYALIQWTTETAIAAAPTTSRSKHWQKKARKIRTTSVIKTGVISIPSSVEIKEATLLPHAVAMAKGKTGKVSATPNRYLALLGIDIQSGHTWLLGLKPNSGDWINCPELFQDVPPFLFQTNSAKTKFSGNSLVITMGGASGYELVMPLADSHFAFSTREAQDSASAVAHQFLLALQYKRLDLAKVWLIDPKLVSIPAYLGLFNRVSDSPSLKLIGMSPPISGGSRFRLITSTKDDLIIDVGKVKNQLLIKGLFIAPANQSIGFGLKTNQN